MEDEFRRTPTWHAKCQISGSGRPLRFEHWGVHEDLSPTSSRLEVSQRSRLLKELHKRHKVYTGSGHCCGVIPYSSVWCGGLPFGLMMMSNTTKSSLVRVCSWLGDELLEGVQSPFSLSLFSILSLISIRSPISDL